MLNLHLTYAEQIELFNLLHSSHRLRVGIYCMDLSHRYIGNLTPTFLDGSVSIDVDADVTRSASLSLLDISRSIQLAPDDPDDGAAFPTRMLQIVYGVGRPDASRWYDIPIFTGPVSKADRNGAVLSVECLGKESLSSSAIWTAKTYKPRWNKMLLIQNLMSTMAGETRFDLARSTHTTSTKTVINRDTGSSLWQWTRNIANSMAMQAFYDGRGYLRVRPRPVVPVWLFDGNFITGEAQTSFNFDTLYNAVEVTGGTPKGKKKPLTYKAVAASSHPLSPVSLGVNGVPRYIPMIVQNTDLKKAAQLKAFGDQLLRDGLLQAVDASFPSFVIPHIEEDDMYSLRTHTFSTDARVRKATIPLQCDDYMSVGYTKRLKPRKLTRALRRA